MRLHNFSSRKFRSFCVSNEDYKGCIRARKVLTKVCQPHSTRSGVDGSSLALENTFEPVINDGIQICNNE